MSAGQIEGLISLALGVFMFLVAAGRIAVSKNPIANAAFVKRWRWVFVIATIFLVVRGGILLAGLRW